MIQFTRATKTRSKLRLALIGPAGSGKTYSALAMATALGEKVAVMDSERGSASLYADLFEFDVVEPDSFSPQAYIAVIRAAEQAGYDVLVIDSLSHAWAGKDGALEMVDKAAARTKSGSSFAAWRKVTPHHNAMVDALIGANLHLIATLRSKTEYVQEKDERGKTVIRKVGLQPVQRDGLEYEFTVVGDIDQDHRLAVTKTRCPLIEGEVIEKPGPELAKTLLGWLSEGREPPVPEPAPPADERPAESNQRQAERNNGVPPCPKCGGPVYDNRPKKRSGGYSPNAPDFKCRDKSCDGKIWPPKQEIEPATETQLDRIQRLLVVAEITVEKYQEINEAVGSSVTAAWADKCIRGLEKRTPPEDLEKVNKQAIDAALADEEAQQDRDLPFGGDDTEEGELALKGGREVAARSPQEAGL